MIDAPTLEEVADSLVSDARDDYLALCMISGAVREKLSLTAVEDYADEPACGRVKSVTLQVVSLMLGKGARAITLNSSRPGFVEWHNQRPDYVLARITREWDVERWARIGRDPDPGEVVWFFKP